jgi:hypothetical protein
MVTLVRYDFRTHLRKAALSLLAGYASAAGLQMQLYGGRPVSFIPPTGFVDRFHDEIRSVGPNRRQRNPVCDVVVVHGRYDFADTAGLADAFVDGFLDYVLETPHAAGTNTLVEIVAVEDNPNYVPDWQPPDRQYRYYASRFALKGLAFD